jgi:hypothetical protein
MFVLSMLIIRPALNWLGLQWDTGAEGFPSLFTLAWQMIVCLVVVFFVHYAMLETFFFFFLFVCF